MVQNRGYIPKSRQREKPREGLKYIGKSMKRVEDPRILTGKGVYADDISFPEMAHVAIVKSSHAHARIKRIDTSKAEKLPGVLAVLTGAQAAEICGPLPTWSSPPVFQRVIAHERVRHVGEAVAAVCAESRYIAEDACDLIEVEYEPLPVVVDPEKALESRGAAVLHPEHGDTNLILESKFDFGPVKEDFAAADHIVKRRYRWPRSGGTPMETNGATAVWDEGSQRFTIYVNSSMYNFVGWMIADTLKIPHHKLNIVPTLAGGSFGAKLFLYKQPVMAAMFAKIVGRPVKYLEDRLEASLNNDAHASDRVYYAELACKKDGTFLSFRQRIIDDYGAYFQYGVGQHGNALAQVVGPYKINSVGVHVQAVLTNKNQQGAYRGFGSEVANFVIERMVDAASEELGIDFLELRRKNFIQPDQFPYLIPTGNMYDSGDYEKVLDETLKILDYKGWKKKVEEMRKAGRYVGIGIATTHERSVFSSTEFWMWNLDGKIGWTSSPDSMSLKIDPRGRIYGTLHSPFWGNSPETVATQVIAEQFQVDPSNIEITYSDTDKGLHSTGPGGSRFTVMVTGAIVGAAAILKKKIFKIAAHMLEANPDDMEMRDGHVSVKGAPQKKVSLQDLAFHAYYMRLSMPDPEDPDLTSGLDATYVYDHPVTTLPDPKREHMGIFYPIMGHMCHSMVVEVDPETGQFKFLDYACVHDSGVMINPMTLEGHMRGGVVNGIGSATSEHYYYDKDGQPTNNLFTDYLLPSISESPANMKCGHVETPSPFTEYGIKGGGEGGRMGTPPALAQAIEDALSPLGIKITELPLTQRRIRQLVREAQAKKAAD